MKMRTNIINGFSMLTILAVLSFVADTGMAQPAVDTGQQVQTSAPTVTAASWAEAVRFSAPSNITHVRLEVYSSAGEKVFDSGNRDGNVLDWRWQDEKVLTINGDSYLCVVTVQSLSGKTSRKLAYISFGNQKVTLQPVDSAHLNPVQAQALGVNEADTPVRILGDEQSLAANVLAHDGSDGQITRTRGAFSFRLGDFFTARDTEQMRLTEEGNLGVGTTKPRARLDVAGDIRASGFLQATRGIQFADGTVQTTALSGRTDSDGNIIPSVAGTGTTNQITKWTDTVGTLGDSTITEVNGRVGIGITNPSYRLVVGPDIGPGLTTSDLTVSRGAGQSVSIYAGASGANGMNFGWDQTNLRAFVNAPVQSPITFTHGGVSERMRIATNGNISIGGITIPGSTLDVRGEINATMHYNLKGTRILSTPGEGNLFVGVAAGPFNPMGGENAYFGFNAGAFTTTGGGNSFFGYLAGQGLSTANFNSIFGHRAGVAGFIGSMGNFNSFFGHRAGEFGNGNSNSFFGTGAGLANGGDSNTFLGHDAGNGNTSGSFNVIVGDSADVGFSNLTNATAIGANALVSENNSLVLGSIKDVNGATEDTNVGIGTTAPESRLHVNVPSLGTPISAMSIDVQSFQTPGNAQASHYFRVRDIGSGSPSAFFIRGDGHIGVGTEAPSDLLTVNGGASKPGGGSWSVFSDQRLKTIKGPFTSGLKAVMQLQPLRYEYKRDNALSVKSEGEHVGFSAQAVQRIIPEAVTKNGQGYLLVNNDPILWTMLNAIKEQQAQIERQQKQIDQLTRFIARQTLKIKRNKITPTKRR